MSTMVKNSLKLSTLASRLWVKPGLAPEQLRSETIDVSAPGTGFLACYEGPRPLRELRRFLRRFRPPRGPVAARLLDSATCAIAAFRGELFVLSWLAEQGCPWDERVCYYSTLCGHFTMLQWAVARGCPFGPRTEALAETLGWPRFRDFLRASAWLRRPSLSQRIGPLPVFEGPEAGVTYLTDPSSAELG